MTQFLQTLVLGVLIGGVYALMASGLTLIFGVMRIINIAQGAFLILVAILTWWLWRPTGIDPIARRRHDHPADVRPRLGHLPPGHRPDPGLVAVDVGAADLRRWPWSSRAC